MDCYSTFVRFQSVNPHHNAHECRMQWAVGLEIGRHVDAHSQRVVSCLSGEIETVRRRVQGGAIFSGQARIERANPDRLFQINSRTLAPFLEPG